MNNFVSIVGTFAHKELVYALSNYEGVYTRLTTLDGFMELASTALLDAKKGNTELLDALDLMSDILTDYFYRGDDRFGRTQEAGELAESIDKFCFDCGFYA